MVMEVKLEEIVYLNENFAKVIGTIQSGQLLGHVQATDLDKFEMGKTYLMSVKFNVREKIGKSSDTVFKEQAVSFRPLKVV